MSRLLSRQGPAHPRVDGAGVLVLAVAGGHHAVSSHQAPAQAPSAATPANPSGNVALGERMAAARGWTGGQWNCLYALWHRESGWDVLAPTLARHAPVGPVERDHDRLRDPAESARAEDGRHWAGLAHQSRDPDPLGPQRHRRRVRHAVRRMGARAESRLVLGRPAKGERQGMRIDVTGPDGRPVRAGTWQPPPS